MGFLKSALNGIRRLIWHIMNLRQWLPINRVVTAASMHSKLDDIPGKAVGSRVIDRRV